MKKLLSSVLSVILVASTVFAFTACGGSKPAETTKAPETAAPATTAAESKDEPAETTEDDGKTYTLIVSSMQPAMAAPTRLLKETMDSIVEATNGKVQYELYDSGNLLAAPDALKGVQDKTADISIVLGNFCYDYCKINARLLVAPFMGYKSQDQAIEIYDTLREEFPEVDAEFDKIGLVNLAAWFNGRADLYMHGKDVAISGIDDFKGMKIGVSDSYLMQLFNGIGATASFVTNADMYTSLDNGVVAGIAQHPAVLNNTGCGDTIHTVVRFGSSGLNISTGLILMNSDTFKGLPENVQQIILEKFDEYQVAVQATQVAEAEAMLEILKNETFIDLTDEQIAPFKEKGQEIINGIIKDLEADGVDGQKIYDRVQELIAK